MEIKKPREALEAYKAVLVEAPNRFDGLLGAARASVAIGDAAAARDYFAKLAAIADKSADRVELAEARNYLEKGTTAQVGGGARREK